MIKSYIAKLKFGPVVALAALLLLIAGGSMAAAQSISIGYLTNDTGLKEGMVAGLSEEMIDGSPAVERARMNRAKQIVGVSVSQSAGLITIASQGSQVFVVNSGEAEVFVTDSSGSISSGDHLVISPLDGVLMKAPQGITGVATALDDFDTSTAEDVEVRQNNSTQTRRLGKVRAVLHLDPSDVATEGTSFASRLSRWMTDQNLSAFRLIAALVVFIVLLIIEGSLMHGAISGAVTSIGRNPLSRGMVRRTLMHSFAAALVVFTIGMGVVLALLWL